MNKLDQRLPLSNVELAARFRQTKALKKGEETDDWDDLNELAHDAVVEVYGQPKLSDFDNISDTCAFFAPKQNLFREIIKAEQHPRDTTPNSPKPKPLTKSQMQKRRKKKAKRR